MATTLIENIVNELTELIVQKVLEEFNQRTDEVAARLNALERADFVNRADLCSNFVTRDDLLVDEALINDRLLTMENTLSAQPLVDKNFVDERIERWVNRNLHEVIVEIVDNYDIDYKIQSAIEDTDFDDAIKEAVYECIDDELESKGFLDEEDLERYLDHYRFVNEDDLIEFLNDRVRITVE